MCLNHFVIQSMHFLLPVCCVFCQHVVTLHIVCNCQQHFPLLALLGVTSKFERRLLLKFYVRKKAIISPSHKIEKSIAS